jgi:restriction endonuclease S subunit
MELSRPPLLYVAKAKDIGGKIVAEAYSPEYLLLGKQLVDCVNMGDISHVRSGKTPKIGKILDRNAFQGGTVLFLKTRHVHEGYLNLRQRSYINEEADDTIMRNSKVIPGDVLMTIIGASLDVIGRAVVFPQSLKRANINQNVVRIRSFDQELILPEYLEAFLNSPIGRTQIESAARCVGQFNLNVPEVRAIKVPLPEPAMQRQIADIWINAKNIREKNHGLRIALRREIGEKMLFPSSGINLPQFGDIDFFIAPSASIEQRLTVEAIRSARIENVLQSGRGFVKHVPLGELIDFREEYVSPKENPEAFYQLVQVGFNGSTKLREERAGRDIQYDKMKVVRMGDILVSRINAIYGAISVVPRRFDKALVSGECHVLVPRKKEIEPVYLWMALRLKYVRALLEGKTSGGTKLRVSDRALSVLPIPFPPRESQLTLSKVVEDDLIRLRELAREIHSVRKQSKAKIRELIMANLDKMTFDALGAKLKRVVKNVISTNEDVLKELAKY